MTPEQLYNYILEKKIQNVPVLTVRDVAIRKKERQLDIYTLAIQHPDIKVLAEYEIQGIVVKAKTKGDCLLDLEHKFE